MLPVVTRKIHITFLEPIVYPQYRSYRFGALYGLSDTVKIHVGFITQNTNIRDTYSIREWCLYDSNGVLVRQGEINVHLNTFNSSVIIGGLLMNAVYSFVVTDHRNIAAERAATRRAAIVSSVADIGVINENDRFIEKPRTMGDVDTYKVGPEWYIRFIENLPITQNEGNGVIMGTLQGSDKPGTYVYAPTAIYTRNRNAPARIDFIPFTGFLSIAIPIYQLPTIIRERNHKYSIDPPTKVRIVWKVGHNVMSYESEDQIGTIDMEKVTAEPISSLSIEAVYTLSSVSNS
jgi:hypothetical protein